MYPPPQQEPFAKLFSETAPITGIVLTKLDGTAKGGIVISIKNELGIPVKLIGVGEKIDDLQPFNSRMFVDALFDLEDVKNKAAEREEEAEVAEVLLFRDSPCRINNDNITVSCLCGFK